MLGMHGTFEANMAMQNCDVLLAVGARFDDRVIGNPQHFAAGNPARKIIHIDVDPSSISKRVKVDVPIVGGVKEVLHELHRAAEGRGQRSPMPRRSPPGGRRSTAWRAKDCLKYDRASPIIKPQMRDREALRGHQGRRVRHLRRGPAPDVGRAVLPLRQAAALDQFRRPRDHGRGAALRDGREARVPGRATSRASRARPRSRCASRSSPPASSTTCR